MKNLIKFIKNKVALISLSMGNVEKSILSQIDETTNGDISYIKKVNQGKLSDALERGEITQEVKDLRWRTYKILKATENLKTLIIGYEEDGTPITKTERIDNKNLKKLKIDYYDDYPPIMVINNVEIGLGIYQTTNIEKLKQIVDIIKTDDDGDSTKSIAEIDLKELESNIKSEKFISIDRDIRPKFKIEDYTKKLVVRDMGDSKRLLEFYISKYPDSYDRKTNLLISNIKKAINNHRTSDLLDINGVKYITYKAIGVRDFLLYEYEIIDFDKIVEFNGHYVIKFKALVKSDGIDTVDKFKEELLEEKYNNKEKK